MKYKTIILLSNTGTFSRSWVEKKSTPIWEDWINSFILREYIISYSDAFLPAKYTIISMQIKKEINYSEIHKMFLLFVILRLPN